MPDQRIRVALAAVIAAAALGTATNVAAGQEPFYTTFRPSAAHKTMVQARWVKAAELIAARHWHHALCAGDHSGSRQARNARANGWVRVYFHRLDADTVAEVYDDVDGCYVSINPAYFSTADWPAFCSVMMHEYGHLTGQEHTSGDNGVPSRPDQLMDAFYDAWDYPQLECVENGPATATADPVAAK